MRFLIKNLMITVVPRAAAGIDPEVKDFCLLGTGICRAPSCGPHSPSCQYDSKVGPCPTPTCWKATVMCTDAEGTRIAWVLNDREDLAVLREELQETLKQLDQMEATLPSGIGSLADAKELEGAFSEAIERIGKTAKDLK